MPIFMNDMYAKKKSLHKLHIKHQKKINQTKPTKVLNIYCVAIELE